MKHYKPGQFCTINNVLYRAKRREPGLGCKGCVLDSLIACPNIVDSRNGIRPLDCTGDDIIFVKV